MNNPIQGAAQDFCVRILPVHIHPLNMRSEFAHAQKEQCYFA